MGGQGGGPAAGRGAWGSSGGGVRTTRHYGREWVTARYHACLEERESIVKPERVGFSPGKQQCSVVPLLRPSSCRAPGCHLEVFVWEDHLAGLAGGRADVRGTPARAGGEFTVFFSQEGKNSPTPNYEELFPGTSGPEGQICRVITAT